MGAVPSRHAAANTSLGGSFVSTLHFYEPPIDFSLVLAAPAIANSSYDAAGIRMFRQQRTVCLMPWVASGCGPAVLRLLRAACR
ncbi:MAG: hypothetical protein M1274_05660 [Actinobacteria bacterium]|nr:hypothetical protein [Actinomycetota bacterium]